jgi:hypothetical protein
MSRNKTCGLAVTFLAVCVPSSAATAESPTPAEIEAAINEGVDLKYAQFQSVSDTSILRGGETAHGDFLYLCNANVIWDIGSEELTENLKSEIASAELPDGFRQFLPMAEIVTAALRNQLGEFESGDVVHSIRMRVRLEFAGDDWIVTQLRTSSTEFKGNPLESLKAGNNS